MGKTPPPKPPSDYASFCAVNAYRLASRARRYEQGVALPLSVGDVLAALSVAPCPVDEWLMVECVLAMDDAYLDKASGAKK